MEYLAFFLGDNLCGLPVLQAREVLRRPPPLARVPGAPLGVAGVAHYRGRIMAVLRLHDVFGLEGPGKRGAETAVVIENKGELYCLAVDAVRGVLSFDSPPAPASALRQGAWRGAVGEVRRTEDGLMSVLDISGIIERICRNNEEKGPRDGDENLPYR